MNSFLPDPRRRLYLPLALVWLVIVVVLACILFSYDHPPETPAPQDPKIVTWLLETAQAEIALPTGITSAQATASYYLGGFGDSDAIIQIQSSPVLIQKFQLACHARFKPAQPDDAPRWPDKFNPRDFDLAYQHALDPSVTYHCLFSTQAPSSLLLRRIKR